MLNGVEKEESPEMVEDEPSRGGWVELKKRGEDELSEGTGDWVESKMRGEDELSEGTGDWVGSKKTVEVTVIVTGPASEGVEEEGSTGGVEEGLKRGSTEDGSIESMEEGREEEVQCGRTEDLVEGGSTEVRKGSTEDGPPKVLLERVSLFSNCLRERSERVSLGIGRSQEDPRICVSARHILTSLCSVFRRTVPVVSRIQMTSVQRSGGNTSKRRDESEDDQRLESHGYASDVW